MDRPDPESKPSLSWVNPDAGSLFPAVSAAEMRDQFMKTMQQQDAPAVDPSPTKKKRRKSGYVQCL